jgi:hypothetical protein
MSDIAKGVVVRLRVTGTRSFRLRLGVGLWLMKFGARVAGFGRVEITP